MEPSPSNHFRNNVEAIKNFPDQPSAQIKAFGRGYLSRTDASFSVSWLKGRTSGTRLEETVKVIDTTLKTSMSKFKKHLENNKLNKSERGLRKLERDAERNRELLEGLKKIEKVYGERYPKDDHEGIKELHQMVRDFEAEVLKQEQQYQKVSRSLPKQLKKSLEEEKAKIGEKADATLTSPEIDPLIKSIEEPIQPSNLDALSDLSTYCQTYCPSVNPAEVQEWIKEGQELVQNILTGKVKKPSSKPKKAEQQMVSLTWYLMSLSLSKKEGYREGTFVVEDPDQRLTQFLQHHPQVYFRQSSHFVKRSPSKHQGIDVLNGLLPANKRTLLFSTITNLDGTTLLYIKPENFSANKAHFYDFGMHGWEFVEAQYNKLARPGSDDLPDMRKERVPAATIKAFEQIVKQVNLHPSFYKVEGSGNEEEGKSILAVPDPLQQAKLYGIAFMSRYVQALEDLDEKPADFNPQPFYQSIEGLDHLDRRTGREVFLTQQDLLKTETQLLPDF